MGRAFSRSVSPVWSGQQAGPAPTSPAGQPTTQQQINQWMQTTAPNDSSLGPFGPPPVSSGHEAAENTYVDGDANKMAAGEARGGEHRNPRLAAKAFGEAYIARSAKDNREYFSYIVKVGKLYSHASVMRSPMPYWINNPSFNVKPSAPEYKLVKNVSNLPPAPGNAVATVHTHGDPNQKQTTSAASADDHAAFHDWFKTSAGGIDTHFVISAMPQEVLWGKDRATMYEYRVRSDGKKMHGYWGDRDTQGNQVVWERLAAGRRSPRL